MAIASEGCALCPQDITQMVRMKRNVAFSPVRRVMARVFDPCHHFNIAYLLDPRIRVELAKDGIATGI